MWRRCGGWFWPAESNSSVPLQRMRPRSGVTSPATMLIIEVLPEPDGPNSAVTPSAASNFAAMLKSPSCFSTSTTSMSATVQSSAGTPRQPLGGDQRDERDNDRNDREPSGRCIAAGDLQIGIDRRRDGLRLTRNIGDKRDGGAEFAERLGEAQHHAGDDAGQGER